MAWEIAHAESFPLDLGRAPRRVRNAWQRTVLPILRHHPDKADPPTIKKLSGFKSLWRLRVSDEYRLIYRVDHDVKSVVLLILDHRSKVYDRAGVAEDDAPASRIVVQAPELLEKQPNDADVGVAELDLAALALVGNPEERSLERPIGPEFLESWGVPAKYHPHFTGVATMSELIALSSQVPEAIMERVLNGLWPPAIEEIIQEPVRVASEAEDILNAAEGGRDLESFLLKLDEEQSSFVGRFGGPSPSGPWLLKGGPGSGKSTVALYCVASLIRRQADQLPMGQRPLRILFTTFTHSLINASSHLLESMGVSGVGGMLTVENVDRLAARDISAAWRSMKVLSESEITEFATAVLAECLLDDEKFGFTRSDITFLVDEIDWVIVGQDVLNHDAYLKTDRAGRGRSLTESQRRQVWEFWLRLKARLEANRVCTFSQRLQAAFRNATAKYDYVFIDEAQDLKPVAIRYCVRLCHTPSRVFLTADSNQSIYGTGMSWPRVAEDLNFKGRAKTLRRNYRTTSEIWAAIFEFGADGADRETLEVETVYSGPYPLLTRYGSLSTKARALNDFLTQSLLQERLPSCCAAVLCPTYREAQETAAGLAPELNARAMRSKDTDLAHPGVKVLTMHAAKGLQFPVVAVTGLKMGVLPKPLPAGMDETEHHTRQKRLLFVACSRAMRRLAIFAPTQNPSPYVTGLSDEFWEIIDVG